MIRFNGHNVPKDIIPQEFQVDIGNKGPGAYDCFRYKGVEITSFDMDPQPSLYTGPWCILWDDGSVLEEYTTLEDVKNEIDHWKD